MAATAPDVAIFVAARAGGIQTNRSAPGAFLYENLMIAANAIAACRQADIEQVVILGRRASIRGTLRSRCRSPLC